MYLPLLTPPRQINEPRLRWDPFNGRVAHLAVCLDDPSAPKGPAGLRNGLREQHLAFLRASDRVHAVGPLFAATPPAAQPVRGSSSSSSSSSSGGGSVGGHEGDVPVGTLLIAHGHSPAELASWLAGDPYAAAGLYCSTAVQRCVARDVTGLYRAEKPKKRRYDRDGNEVPLAEGEEEEDEEPMEVMSIGDLLKRRQARNVAAEAKAEAEAAAAAAKAVAKEEARVLSSKAKAMTGSSGSSRGTIGFGTRNKEEAQAAYEALRRSPEAAAEAKAAWEMQRLKYGDRQLGGPSATPEEQAFIKAGIAMALREGARIEDAFDESTLTDGGDFDGDDDDVDDDDTAADD